MNKNYTFVSFATTLCNQCMFWQVELHFLFSWCHMLGILLQGKTSMSNTFIVKRTGRPFGTDHIEKDGRSCSDTAHFQASRWAFSALSPWRFETRWYLLVVTMTPQIILLSETYHDQNLSLAPWWLLQKIQVQGTSAVARSWIHGLYQTWARPTGTTQPSIVPENHHYTSRQGVYQSVTECLVDSAALRCWEKKKHDSGEQDGLRLLREIWF